MKKIIFAFSLLMLVVLIACTQPIETTTTTTAPSGDPAVDSIADEINDITSTDEDLDIDELDLDSTLQDIENI
jgi:hypothetical protein